MTIHFMQYGHTACLMDEPPDRWPEGHKWTGDTKEVNCAACLAGMKWGESSYELLDKGTAFKCRRCGLISHHPEDVANHYCGQCHAFHDDIWPPARKAWIEEGQRLLRKLDEHFGRAGNDNPLRRNLPSLPSSQPQDAPARPLFMNTDQTKPVHFRQHMPGFCDFDPWEDDFESLDALLQDDRIARLAQMPEFSEFKRSESLLMAVFKGGAEWWVLGYVTPAEALAPLPEWREPQ